MYLIKTLLVRTCEPAHGIEQKDASYLIRYKGYLYDRRRGLLIQRTRFEPQAVAHLWEVPGPGERAKLAEVIEPVEMQECGTS